MAKEELRWQCPTCHKTLTEAELDVMIKSRVAVPVIAKRPVKKKIRRPEPPMPVERDAPSEEEEVVEEYDEEEDLTLD